jgi:hypothetical protein
VYVGNRNPDHPVPDGQTEPPYKDDKRSGEFVRLPWYVIALVISGSCILALLCFAAGLALWRGWRRSRSPTSVKLLEAARPV